MAITFVGVGALRKSSVGVNPMTAVPIPAGTILDDFMLMFVFGKPRTGGAKPEWAPPSGWSERLVHVAQASANFGFEIYSKTAGASESDPDSLLTLGDPAKRWSSFIVTYRGVDTVGGPFDVVSPVERSLGDGSTSTPEGVTTLNSNALVICMTTTIDDNALSQTTANGFTVRASGTAYHNDDQSNSDHSAAMSDKIVASPSASGGPTYTLTINGPDSRLEYSDSLLALSVAGGPPALKRPIGAMVGLGKMMDIS